MTSDGTKKELDDLEWVKDRPKREYISYDERYAIPPSGFQRFKKKFLENPFVPLGVIMTISCMVRGVQPMLRGEYGTLHSNMMMRKRIMYQGLTIGACILGSIYYSYRNDDQCPNKLEQEQQQLPK